MKMKMMNFADGIKPVMVGMDVVYSNGQGGRHYRINEATITKVGNKLVTLNDYTQFYLDTGLMKSEYTHGRLHSSRENYDKLKMENEYIQKLQYKLSYSHGTSMNYEKAQQIAKILDIDMEDKHEEKAD